MFSSHAAQIGVLLVVGVCLAAASSRRPAQLLAAAGVASAWIASAALQDRHAVGGPQYAIFALDILVAVGFTTLALVHRGAWLMALAAFQLLTAATHVGMIVDTRIFVRAYLTAYLVWSYLVVAALAWGAWAGWKERREAGTVG